MTVEEIKKYLAEHKSDDGVKALLAELTPGPTADQVEKFLDSDEGFNSLRSRFDRYAQKAITTHDEKRKAEIERQIEEAVAKAKKESTLSVEEQMKAEMAELRTELKRRDTDLARRDLISKLRDEAEKLHVPLDIAVDLDNPNLTEERAMERMQAYAKRHADEISTEVNQRLVGTPKPGSGNAPKPVGDLRKLSVEEAIALEEKGELNARLQ